MKDYLEFIKKDFNKGIPLILGCNCAVKYSGRAESYLEFNDCIIMIKSDKTLLVHQSTGNMPINYMKTGTHIEFQNEGENLQINASNQAMKEYMNIIIKKIYFYNSHPLAPGNALILEGTEKDMADMILNEPEIIESGFKPLTTEEHTKYGFIDVFGYDNNKILCVIECKRYTGDFKAVDQLRRYVEKIKNDKGIKEVRGILACPAITPNAKKMLEDFGFEHKRIEPPKRLAEYKKNQMKLNEF